MAGLIVIALYIAAIIGWVMNIYKLVTTAGPVAAWTAFEIARCIGIPFGPLGSVLGYF